MSDILGTGVWGLEVESWKIIQKYSYLQYKIRAFLPIAFIYIGSSGCQKSQCYNSWDLPEQA